MLYTILIVVLVLVLIGGLPLWPHMASSGWGWGPSGVVGIILVVVLILLLTGRL